MDMVLIFLYVLFGLITVLPFVYFQKNEKKGNVVFTNTIELREERRILMDNLKDLKMDLDTGKLTTVEFNDLSQGIIVELQKLDKNISEIPVSVVEKNLCSCGYKIEIANARFCPSCGKKLS